MVNTKWNNPKKYNNEGQPYASPVVVKNLDGEVLRVEEADNENVQHPDQQVVKVGRKKENRARQKEWIVGQKMG